MSDPMDVLAAGTVTVSAEELKWLLTSATALRVLADYNDYNETMADACGADSTFNRQRRQWFHAEAARIESEWEADRAPEQRVFVDNPATPMLLDALTSIVDGGLSTSRIVAARAAIAAATGEPK